MVAIPHVTQRAKIGGSGKTETVFVAAPYYGIHETNIAAKRAYVTALEPERANHPDHLIALQFRSYSQNWKNVKIVRVPKP